ncbi:MAG: FAD-binding oxidoreductase [Ktedonobacteraceae bacterium]
MHQTSIEIAIIGGGVIGSSIAYHLAKQGGKVLVIERSQVATAPTASWASAGGVRRQGRHPAEAQLASEAIERWQTLEQELEADLHYRRGGNLLLAESDIEAGQLTAFVQHQHSMGFTDVRLLDRQEILTLVPGLNAQVVAGSYSPKDGQADPVLTTRAFAAAAQRHGASYWPGTSALSLRIAKNRITGIETEQGQVQAEHIILAAGAWSNALLTPHNLQLPIRTRALQMLLSTPTQADLFQPVISAIKRILSLKQLPDGSFLLGGGWLGDVTTDQRSFTLRPASRRGNWQTACDLLPLIGQQRIAQAWCGLEAQSIDDLPLLGPLPHIAGLTLALGFSGHGFAISPAIGRASAAQLNGQATPELKDLSSSRISSMQPNDIASFITETVKTDIL